LRGLISAANDFTVLIAACLAFRLTLIAASENKDRDFSEVVDGEHPHFRLAMINERGQVLSLFTQVKYVCVLYSFKEYHQWLQMQPRSAAQFEMVGCAGWVPGDGDQHRPDPD